MHMVAHQAKSMNKVAEARYTVSEQRAKEGAVSRGEENVLLGVTTQDDEIQGAGDVKAGLAGRDDGHGTSIPAQYAST
jgi:hypothetical protein